MLIESLELHNIKSYDSTGCKLEFRPGVNLIWGENGSGKSTILEAIGYCLFDVMSYNLDQFVRGGASDGQLILTFEHQDGRRYAIVREIKNTSSLKIRDVETGRYLLTRRKDAEDWISMELGIEFGKYSRHLFENAIGVPQGKMTSSFGVAEAARKTIFDPILRVEEYNQAYKNLARTRERINELLQKARLEQSNLQVRLEQLPRIRQRLENLLHEINAGQMQLELAQEQLADLEDELRGLDEVQNNLKAMILAIMAPTTRCVHQAIRVGRKRICP